jgi:hypothetical protein
MERIERYKGFVIRAFEREAERWQAEIKKLDGTAVTTAVPHEQHPSITSSPDSFTADDAIKLAKRVIDVGGVT